MPLILILLALLIGGIALNLDAAKNVLGEVDNNPGNLEDHDPPTPWQGRVGYVVLIVHGQPRRFVKFDRLEDGVRALMINVLSVAARDPGNMTLAEFGEIWAPTADNPGASLGAYGGQIAAFLGVDKDTPFDFASSLINVARGVIKNERGTAALASVPPTLYLPAQLSALHQKGLV